MTVCGTLYKESCILVVGSEEEYPIFGKVVAIYVLKKMVIFRSNIFHTVTYDPHFHAYVVQLTNLLTMTNLYLLFPIT